MSGATTAIWAGAAIAGASLVNSVYQGKREGDRARSAAERQVQQAKRAEDKADQEFNRANQTQPDISQLLDGNTSQGNATQLVGSGGVGLDSSMLGKGNGLLG